MDLDLDQILVELGHFGWYQSYVMFLLILCGIYKTNFAFTYVFTADMPNHRCEITECEVNNSNNYNPWWLKFAVPYYNDKPASCERYAHANDFHYTSNCTQNLFNQSYIEKCSSFVFETNENTMAKEFDFLCDETEWKITMVGTLNNVGQFAGMLIGGYFADRFGRKSVLIAGSMLSAVTGISRSFAPNYSVFMVFEILDAVITSGVTSSAYILAVELVSPEKRVFATTVFSCLTYPIGEILIGFVAWQLQDWRIYLKVLYAPGILFIFYIWLIPESLRWLITKKRYSEVKRILNKIAKVNKKTLSTFWKEQLDLLDSEEVKSKEFRLATSNEVKSDKDLQPNDLFKSKILQLRLANCSFCWMVQTFVYYGLAMNSVVIGGNKYVNFMLTGLVEIPGYLGAQLTLDRLGRRWSLCFFVISAGMSCVLFYFISGDFPIARLVLFLVGKGCITASFAVAYIVTTEIFPTSLRNSALGFCSMFGRIGSMIVAQTPLLANLISPYLLFGFVSLVCGILSLLLPETLNVKLPDTIQEAETIGKTKIIKEDEK